MIKCDQNASLKSCIDRNTKLRKKTKNNFERDFFKLINNPVFGKTIAKVRKQRNIEFVKTERRRNYVVSEPNYHTTKFSTENSLAIKMRKTELLTNKPLYLGLSILDLCKTVIYEFWYDYTWWKGKTLLYEYRQLHCSCKNRRYL